MKTEWQCGKVQWWKYSLERENEKVRGKRSSLLNFCKSFISRTLSLPKMSTAPRAMNQSIVGLQRGRVRATSHQSSQLHATLSWLSYSSSIVSNIIMLEYIEACKKMAYRRYVPYSYVDIIRYAIWDITHKNLCFIIYCCSPTSPDSKIPQPCQYTVTINAHFIIVVHGVNRYIIKK